MKTTLNLGLEFLMDQINFVMDLNNNDTEVPEDQLEEQALHLNAEEFVSQPKAKAIPQRTCWLFTEYHSDEQKDLD